MAFSIHNLFLSFELVSEVDPKDIGNIASRISKTNESKVAQIRGLPWAVDKAYIMRLFPSKKLFKLEKKKLFCFKMISYFY